MQRNRRLHVAIVTAAVLLCGAAIAGWRIFSLQQTAFEARDHLVAARAVLSQDSLNGPSGISPESPSRTDVLLACQNATAAHEALQEVNNEFRVATPLVAAIEGLPQVGSEAKNEVATLDVGTHVAAASASVCDALLPVAAAISGDSNSGGPRSAQDALQMATEARPKLVAATERLTELQISLGRIQDEQLDAADREAVIALRKRLPNAISTLRDTVLLLDLMGGTGPRRYLVVSQNPDELRATGGYIGSAGVVVVEAGRVQLAEYGSSRAYDTPSSMRAIPPSEFQEYLGTNYWHLAGANWWASYPDVARQLAYFYGLSQPAGGQVDGVVAVDQFGLRRLLEVVGPVDVPEYNERVDANDLERKLDHYVHAGDQSDELGRKQFTAALSGSTLQAVLDAPSSTLPAVVQAVRASLEEQHLLIWVMDPQAQQFFARKRWDGGLLPSNGDALMLVDTDVAGTKQSQTVRRDAVYAVDLTNPVAPSASTVVTYTNQSRPEQRPDVSFVAQYRTYLRVFVPPGATLVSSSGFLRPAIQTDECERTVFAGEVLIPRATTVRVELKYRLPASVASSGYDLLVQQQPGAPPGSLNVNVRTASGAIAQAGLPTNPGQPGRWRLDAARAQLDKASIPDGTLTGCGEALVEAHPIAAPVSIVVPSAGVDARVVEAGINDQNEMEVPPSAEDVAWYRMSARPGQPGNSVMSGHVDWARKPAVFWGLRGLHEGDPIEVRGADGIVHTYIVQWNQSLPVQTESLRAMVGPSRDSVLTLITCDGPFDPWLRQYLERRIVRAVLVT
jgi:uncharacterized protein DUF4012/sortase family protein